MLVPVFSVRGAFGLLPSLEEGEEEEKEEKEEVGDGGNILSLRPVGRVGKKAARAARGGSAIRKAIQKPPSPVRASVELGARSSMIIKHA